MNPRLTGFGGVFQGRRALVTGHTGFKGSWLCEWLLGLGAQVTGFSQPPETDPALFTQLGLAARMDHVLGDIRGEAAVARVVAETRPDFVFHLAAQPLVRRSYREPMVTWQTNVMGTLHVLEALRQLEHPCAAVVITTDKC
ncbi:MAG: GDP-mannose 4,6-dehydratase, partial [Thermoanaerobaculia bacterium]|nr:GDP-mannose 4,6-dehydratase [Thermoanaerobaculia bacterium]